MALAMSLLPNHGKPPSSDHHAKMASCGPCRRKESSRNVRWKDIESGKELTTVREYVPTDESDSGSDFEDDLFGERKSCCTVA